MPTPENNIRVQVIDESWETLPSGARLPFIQGEVRIYIGDTMYYAKTHKVNTKDGARVRARSFKKREEYKTRLGRSLYRFRKIRSNSDTHAVLKNAVETQTKIKIVKLV